MNSLLAFLLTLLEALLTLLGIRMVWRALHRGGKRLRGQKAAPAA